MLYLICVLTDFAGFVVVFTASRSLAEGGAPAWYLGVAGAGLSLSAGVGSMGGGWLACRRDGRAIFLTGAAVMVASIAACGAVDPRGLGFLPGYWLLGIGLGFLYPPLIGWLNRGEDAHGDRRGVSRRLIAFCVAWNLGMMGGQLAGGSLFERGVRWAYGAAFAVALANFALAVVAARRVFRLPAGPVHVASPGDGTLERAVAFKRLGWIANLGGVFGASMVIHLLPDLAVLIGVPPAEHGNLLACWRAVIIATYLVMHHAAYWHYRLRVSLASQVVGPLGWS